MEVAHALDLFSDMDLFGTDGGECDGLVAASRQRRGQALMCTSVLYLWFQLMFDTVLDVVEFGRSHQVKDIAITGWDKIYQIRDIAITGWD